MEVIAKNSKVRSTLHGVFTPFSKGYKFTYYYSYGGIRFHDILTFSCISDLTDYLLDYCGYDLLTFKKI